MEKQEISPTKTVDQKSAEDKEAVAEMDCDTVPEAAGSTADGEKIISAGKGLAKTAAED